MRAHPAGARHGDAAPLTQQVAPAPADLAYLDPAIWPIGTERRDGAVVLGGVDVRDIAERHGTPVYALVESDVRARCRAYRDAFGDDGVIY